MAMEKVVRTTCMRRAHSVILALYDRHSPQPLPIRSVLVPQSSIYKGKFNPSAVVVMRYRFESVLAHLRAPTCHALHLFQSVLMLAETIHAVLTLV